MPTVVTRYVNANSSGGDGTTNATSGSSAAFASFASFQSAFTNKDLVTQDIQVSVLLEGAGNIGEVDLTYSSNPWDTSATCFLLIRNNTGHRHPGYWDTGVPYISFSDYHGAIDIRGIDYVYLDGLQIENTYTSGSDGRGHAIYYEFANSGGHLQVHNCLLKRTGSTANLEYPAGVNVINNGGDTITVDVQNNIIFGDFVEGIGLYDTAADNVYNIIQNTVIDQSGNGIVLNRNPSSLTINMYNNIASGAGDTDYFIDNSSGTFNHNGNISSDSSSPDASYQSKTVVFEDAGSDDYRLDATDTEALDSGADLSAVGVALQVDIVGTARPQNSDWDIGAFELPAAAGVTGTGELAIGASTIAGAGALTHVGTSALSGAAGIAAGAGAITHTGTAVLSIGASVISGTGETEVTGTGAMIAGSSVIAGAGKITRQGTGALSSAESVIAGSGTAGSPDPNLLDSDDFDGGGFNPSTGDYFNSSYDADTYTTAGTSPFETPASVSIEAPPSGAEYIGRIQWAISGDNELQPFNFGGNGEDDGWDLAEFYFEADFYIPTGFPFCSGKFFRARRLVSGSGVGAAIHLETPPQDSPITSVDPIVSYFALFHLPPSDGEDVNYVDAPARDEWVRIGIWAKYNTFTGSTANADGFAKLYVNDILQDEKTGITFSEDVAHEDGFNFIGAPLNHSYGACTTTAPADGAIWMSSPKLYSTKPEEGEGVLLLAAAAADGSGTVGHVGTSALGIGASSIDASGNLGDFTASGDLSISAASVSGAGNVTHKGTSVLSIGAATLEATGSAGLITEQSSFAAPEVNRSSRIKLKMKDKRTGEIVTVILSTR